MHSQMLAKLYLLIVSLNKSLKRNKLESQCRYHKCIIEQKQTKVTNLLVDSDVKTSKQTPVTNFKIVKQCYRLHGLSKCISAGKATKKTTLERETQRYKGTYIRNAFLNMTDLGRENLTCLQIFINETNLWQQWHRWNQWVIDGQTMGGQLTSHWILPMFNQWVFHE